MGIFHDNAIMPIHIYCYSYLTLLGPYQSLDKDNPTLIYLNLDKGRCEMLASE